MDVELLLLLTASVVGAALLWGSYFGEKPPTSPPSPAEVSRARSGDKIGAVRMYQQRAGGGLRHCKTAVDEALRHSERKEA